MISLILDNIRSVHNVGSIFRIADTIGIDKIYCLGTTPTPLDRFGRVRKDLAKVSLGAENSVSWEYVKQEDVKKLIHSLSTALPRSDLGRAEFISLEQSTDSVDYKKVKIKRGDNTVIILGNEVDGVSKYLLSKSDIIAEIPMRGKKESLNVAVASGIFLFRLLDK